MEQRLCKTISYLICLILMVLKGLSNLQIGFSGYKMRVLWQQVCKIGAKFWNIKRMLLVLSTLMCLSLAPSFAATSDLSKLTCQNLFPNGLENISKQDHYNFMILVFWLAGFEAGAQDSTKVDISRVKEISNTLLATCSKGSTKTCFEIIKEQNQQKQQQLNQQYSNQPQSN